MSKKSPAYWEYLNLQQLLSLQGGLDGDDSKLCPDELHFVIVHQIYELWFKLALRELKEARDQLIRPVVPDQNLPKVVHHLSRVNKILEQGRQHWDLVATLSPQDFLSFRDKLIPASGFQSFQMRELEILMGLKDSDRISYGKAKTFDHIKNLTKDSKGGDHAWKQIEQARSELDLRSAMHLWLYRTPIQGSTPDMPNDDELVNDFIESYLKAMADHQARQMKRFHAIPGGDPASVEKRMAGQLEDARKFLSAADIAPEDAQRIRRVRAALLFIENYRVLPLLAWPRTLIDAMVEFEENMVLFRFRHARMVERMIGRRTGTGGSAGVDYLDKTTAYRVFTELWSVRTLLLPASALPPIKNPSYYEFAQ